MRVLEWLGWIAVVATIAFIVFTWLVPQRAPWETAPYGSGGPAFRTIDRDITVLDKVQYALEVSIPDEIPFYQSAPIRATVTGPSEPSDGLTGCVEVLAPSFAVSAPLDESCFRSVPSTGSEDWRWSLFPESQAYDTQEIVIVATFTDGDKVDTASFATRMDVHKSVLDRTPALAAAAFGAVLAALLTALTASKRKKA